MRATAALAMTATAVAVSWAQPKVAVLEAQIQQNMDPSIVVPVTDKVVEKLVQSGRFIVLDRANIENVLKEREFQVSGMTDQDAVTAGKYLNADFIAVVKVSRVGDTNFVSGKMINVGTGAIQSSTSAQGDGKLAVAIDLASQVGSVLSGGSGAAVVPSPRDDRNLVAPSPPKEGSSRAPSQLSYAPAKTGPTDGFLGLGIMGNSYNWKGSADSVNSSEKIKEDYFSLSFNAVAKHFQFDIGLAWFTSGTYDLSGTSNDASYDITGKMTYLDMDALLRLPLRLGNHMALAFLGGAEYDLNLSYKDSGGKDLKSSMTEKEKSNLNRFLFDLGLGLQLDFGNVILYPQLIYGFKVKSDADRDLENSNQKTASDYSIKAGQLKFGCTLGFTF